MNPEEFENRNKIFVYEDDDLDYLTVDIDYIITKNNNRSLYRKELNDFYDAIGAKHD